MGVGKEAEDRRWNERGLREMKEAGWEEATYDLCEYNGQRTSLTYKRIQTTWALVRFELNKISRVNCNVVFHPATVWISPSVLIAPCKAKQGVIGATEQCSSLWLKLTIVACLQSMIAPTGCCYLQRKTHMDLKAKRLHLILGRGDFEVGSDSNVNVVGFMSLK